MYFSTEDLVIKTVSKTDAKEMIIKNHYSGKWNSTFGIVNIGVYKDDTLLGVAVFGHPQNVKGWGSITKVSPDKCLELNRLWIDDILGKNAETWLMGQSWKILRGMGYELIQSFADGRLGVGTIYQAANFGYYGSHKSTFFRRNDGVIFSDTVYTDTRKTVRMLDINHDILMGRGEVFSVNTYRYLLPLTKYARRSILKTQKPFPKERKGITTLPNTVPVNLAYRCMYILESMNDDRADDFYNMMLSKYTVKQLMNAYDVTISNPWVEKAVNRFSKPLMANTLF